jgi:hypothetical protein
MATDFAALRALANANERMVELFRWLDSQDKVVNAKRGMDKAIRKVGYSTDAIHFLPSKRRSAVQVDDHERVTSWLITAGATRTPRRDDELDDDERRLPLAEIWNHQYLIEAISSSWTPQ